ncbi:uncharacterized protein SAPINGB_P000575 [Magnusiomyces paraingens]|uniref:Uncharacterized protein n=1 Tax=Magnusiomyces paraingens TaxID=2606893 RepID=A0A5E8B7V8_9ASCO|nr:uncharacterized protein SAPINGB_P000575 [Saprochaete ingens]VVT44911.1 unnamed protein product [Saprochaete ingens]
MAYGRPWYVQATDVIHRLTVIGIIGFSGWLTIGLGRTLWANRDSALQKRLAELAEEQEQIENGQIADAAALAVATQPPPGLHANALPSQVEADIAREALASLAEQEQNKN